MNKHFQTKKTARLAIFLIASTVISFFSFVNIAIADNQLIWMGCGISKKAYMGKMAKEYEEKTGVSFRMAGGGATKGIRLTASGDADIGGSCRFVLLKPSGTPIAEENVNMLHVAWDALAVIVNKSNPVKSVTLSQLKEIFEGEIQNWMEVGGNDQPIRLLVRKGKNSGVGRLFRQLVLEDEDFSFPNSSAVFSSSGPLEKNLEQRKSLESGIAITGISSAKKTDLKVLAVNGYKPTKENISTGSYPLFRPLYLTTNRSPSKDTEDFIEFVLSSDGQEIISKEGTVNLSEGIALESLWKEKNLPL